MKGDKGDGDDGEGHDEEEVALQKIGESLGLGDGMKTGEFATTATAPGMFCSWLLALY